MALDSGTSAGNRDGEVVLYRGPHAKVTSRWIRSAHGHFLIRDLSSADQVHVFGHPARTVALICGAIELMLAAPLAVAYGSAALLCAGFISAFGLATALIVDGRRNPRWMALRAIHQGRTVTVFSSRDQQEFGQVRRAVVRAIEADHL
jgi:hypothetical protein